MTELENKRFLNFKNRANLCWLDSVMVMLANMETIKSTVENAANSEIRHIIDTYNEAVALFNLTESNEPKCKKLLEDLQQQMQNYLKKFMKFVDGKPESAFVALFNLIHQDKSSIREHVTSCYVWFRSCECGSSPDCSNIRKEIVTITTELKDFYSDFGLFVKLFCNHCNVEGERLLYFKEIPPCLIFHFENGVGNCINLPIKFRHTGRFYYLTALVMYNKNPNHFLTWIRNPLSDSWIKFDDLSKGHTSFSQVKPQLTGENIYMAAFESFDTRGRFQTVIDVNEDQIKKPNREVITLSDDDD